MPSRESSEVRGQAEMICVEHLLYEGELKFGLSKCSIPSSLLKKSQIT